jgi:protein phosphatase 4 regulatory subunit 3
LVQHLVETAREKMEKLAYMETFRLLLEKYDQIMAPVPDELSFTTVETETPTRTLPTNGQRWQGLKDDHEEEAYFNTSDNEEDEALSPPLSRPVPNGQSPFKPLVDYPEDDEEFALDSEPVANGTVAPVPAPEERPKESTRHETPPPPERLAEKRRREDDDDDELGKLSSQPKRRTSIGSTASNASTGPTLRRKRSLSSNKDGSGKKITISFAVKAENAQVDGQ